MLNNIRKHIIEEFFHKNESKFNPQDIKQQFWNMNFESFINECKRNHITDILYDLKNKEISISKHTFYVTALSYNPLKYISTITMIPKENTGFEIDVDIKDTNEAKKNSIVDITELQQYLNLQKK